MHPSKHSATTNFWAVSAPKVHNSIMFWCDQTLDTSVEVINMEPLRRLQIAGQGTHMVPSCCGASATDFAQWWLRKLTIKWATTYQHLLPNTVFVRKGSFSCSTYLLKVSRAHQIHRSGTHGLLISLWASKSAQLIGPMNLQAISPCCCSIISTLTCLATNLSCTFLNFGGFKICPGPVTLVLVGTGPAGHHEAKCLARPDSSQEGHKPTDVNCLALHRILSSATLIWHWCYKNWLCLTSHFWPVTLHVKS